MLRAKRPEGKKKIRQSVSHSWYSHPFGSLAPFTASVFRHFSLPWGPKCTSPTCARSSPTCARSRLYPRPPVPSIPGRYRQIRSRPRGARLPPARPCILLSSSISLGSKTAGFIPSVGWGTAETGWASGCGDNRSAHSTLILDSVCGNRCHLNVPEELGVPSPGSSPRTPCPFLTQVPWSTGHP